MKPPVVVGVDGTSSHEAVLWAGQAARARGCPVLLVHSVWTGVAGYEPAFADAIETQAKDLLRTHAVSLEEASPGLVVETEVAHETPARALTNRSDDATLVVVGTHHPSTVERVLTGSLTYQVVAGSHCPVAVVPTDPVRRSGGVVVGADGSQESLAAVAFAAWEAARLDTVLHVVHAWQEPAVLLPVGLLAGGVGEQVQEDERLVLAESVAGLAEDHPDLVVRQELVQERPVNALLRRAQDAQLCVVGSRGRNGVQRMLLGSVSHSVVLHAPCPVVVVRA